MRRCEQPHWIEVIQALKNMAIFQFSHTFPKNEYHWLSSSKKQQLYLRHHLFQQNYHVQPIKWQSQRKISGWFIRKRTLLIQAVKLIRFIFEVRNCVVTTTKKPNKDVSFRIVNTEEKLRNRDLAVLQIHSRKLKK